jgi:GntR family transcriptional regulator
MPGFEKPATAGRSLATTAPLRQRPLARQVLGILTERILRGIYAPGTQLPPESVLSQEFNVSRATLRSAIDQLASQGLVRRRQGVGTFVSKVPPISNPLNQFIDFQLLIASTGHEPGTRQLSAEVVEAEDRVQSMLHLQPGSMVLRVRKLFTADSNPVVYCLNHIPVWVFPGGEIPDAAFEPGITEPIFEFYESICHLRIENYVCWVRPEVAQNCEMPEMALTHGPLTPVLVVDEVGYSTDDVPAHHSTEYHPDNLMTFELVRRRGPIG